MELGPVHADPLAYLFHPHAPVAAKAEGAERHRSLPAHETVKSAKENPTSNGPPEHLLPEPLEPQSCDGHSEPRLVCSFVNQLAQNLIRSLNANLQDYFQGLVPGQQFQLADLRFSSPRPGLDHTILPPSR